MGLASEVREVERSLVGGTGVRITRYPPLLIGQQLTASGLATGVYQYAAAGGNVAQIVAKATIVVDCKIVGIGLDTPSIASIFVIKIGNGAGAAGAMTAELFEVHMEFSSDAGGYVPIMLPSNVQAVITADGATDAIVGDAASNNGAADDTINCSVLVATAFGT